MWISLQTKTQVVMFTRSETVRWGTLLKPKWQFSVEGNHNQFVLESVMYCTIQCLKTFDKFGVHNSNAATPMSVNVMDSVPDPPVCWPISQTNGSYPPPPPPSPPSLYLVPFGLLVPASNNNSFFRNSNKLPEVWRASRISPNNAEYDGGSPGGVSTKKRQHI